MKYNSYIFMVKFTNSLESKIQHKYQQCYEKLSTFMEITKSKSVKE